MKSAIIFKIPFNKYIIYINRRKIFNAYMIIT